MLYDKNQIGRLRSLVNLTVPMPIGTYYPVISPAIVEAGKIYPHRKYSFMPAGYAVACVGPHQKVTLKPGEFELLSD
jgi:hypothetical protein